MDRAARAARASRAAPEDAERERRAGRPKAVVVGAGWAGLGAARALSKGGASVSLLDAAGSAGGVSSGWKTERGRTVEAGMKGFWNQYPNLDALALEIGSEDKLTACTRSTFYAYVFGFWVRSNGRFRRRRTPYGTVSGSKG